MRIEVAEEFWKNEKKTKVTKEQIEMFKEAIRKHSLHLVIFPKLLFLG
jgi:hypothetical protein